MLTHKIKDKMNLESKRLSRKYAEDKRPGQKYVRVTLPDSIQEHLDGYMVMDCYDHNNDVVIKCKTNVLFRLLYEFDRSIILEYIKVSMTPPLYSPIEVCISSLIMSMTVHILGMVLILCPLVGQRLINLCSN